MTPERFKEIEEYAKQPGQNFLHKNALAIIEELLQYIEELKKHHNNTLYNFDSALKVNPCKSLPDEQGLWGERFGTHLKLRWSWYKAFYKHRTAIEYAVKKDKNTMEWLD